MATLEYNHYGKDMVRVLRVRREEGLHSVSEWEIRTLIEGGQEAVYLSGDNSGVVPTDTIRNTVLALAYDLETASRDEFALAVARHFTSRYGHLTGCDVEVRERGWERMMIDGRPHEHSFVQDSNGRFFSGAGVRRDGTEKRSGGIRDFVIMKTTGSGFSGFAKCEFTTLPETGDRIFCTSMDAEWEYAGEAGVAGQTVLDAMLPVFASTWSPSVQRTLFLMGEAALEACPGIARIRIVTPNRHYLNLDLSKFGRPEGQRKVFLPTDEPFGFIEAVVGRDA